MWRFILRLVQADFCPKRIVPNFERAAHSAVRKIFLKSQIKCCRFHWGQALFRKIQLLGLKGEYTAKQSEAGKWPKMFFRLPLVPLD
jgi:hypothetical protein